MNSEIKNMKNHESLVIPIGIHGDGVVTTGVSRSWAKTCDCFSWSSLLASGKTTFVNFLIWACFHQNMAHCEDRHTMNQFWRLLEWSFRAMEWGTWPTLDVGGKKIVGDSRSGKDLAGGYRCVLWICKGDLEYWHKVFNLEASGSNMPCILCKANTTTVPWTATHPETSPWLTAGWDTEEDWLLAHPNLPAIFDLPNMTHASISPDWMHTKHLGCDQYLMGSMLYQLTHRVDGRAMMPGRPNGNLIEIWRQISPLHCSFSDLRLSMFVPGTARKFPVLKGKAAEVKHFGSALLSMWEKYMDKSHAPHRTARLALKNQLS